MSDNTQKTDADVKNDVKDAVHDVKNDVKDTAHDVKNQIKDTAHDVNNDIKMPFTTRRTEGQPRDSCSSTMKDLFYRRQVFCRL